MGLRCIIGFHKYNRGISMNGEAHSQTCLLCGKVKHWTVKEGEYGKFKVKTWN